MAATPHFGGFNTPTFNTKERSDTVLPPNHALAVGSTVNDTE